MVNGDTMKYDLITILGPTASGKTALAVALAYELKTEIAETAGRCTGVWIWEPEKT